MFEFEEGGRKRVHEEATLDDALEENPRFRIQFEGDREVCVDFPVHIEEEPALAALRAYVVTIAVDDNIPWVPALNEGEVAVKIGPVNPALHWDAKKEMVRNLVHAALDKHHALDIRIPLRREKSLMLKRWDVLTITREELKHVHGLLARTEFMYDVERTTITPRAP